MSTIERAAARLGKAKPKVDEVRPAPMPTAFEEPVPEPAPVAPAPRFAETETAQVAPQPPVEAPPELQPETAPEPPTTGTVALPPNANPIGGGYAEIDLDQLAEDGFPTRSDVGSHLGLDFRRIKRPLLLNARRKPTEQAPNPPNLLLVTSSLPNEGKTFVSVNLALSIAAEKDYSVLLVDGDSAKGDVANVLDFDYDVGLTDVLQRGGYVEDAVLKTNVPGLSVLPSGPPIADSDELFASDLMVRLVGELANRARNRIVIFDGPPLLAGTEASVLARLMGQVVVVVEADRTQQSTVAEALTQVESCSSVSLVLNKVARRARDHARYGYGYEYAAQGRGG